MPGEPTLSVPWALIAAASVLRSTGGATSALVLQGMITGWRGCALARSPSTITPSIGPFSVEASLIAPAVPSEPLVEASTIVRLRVSPARSRASSISVAVPDRLASAGERRASRWATITMLPVSIPGREATTFSSVLVPLTVRPLKVLVLTVKPLARKLEPTCAASALSPSEPGPRAGS